MEQIPSLECVDIAMPSGISSTWVFLKEILVSKVGGRAAHPLLGPLQLPTSPSPQIQSPWSHLQMGLGCPAS